VRKHREIIDELYFTYFQTIQLYSEITSYNISYFQKSKIPQFGETAQNGLSPLGILLINWSYFFIQNQFFIAI
jgi:hypothetical protein